MSLPEVLLWQELRQRPGGFKFRRQVPLAPYTVDFACLSARLAIEVDGVTHDADGQAARDARRDTVLRERGFEVMRIAAADVLRDLEAVVSSIVAQCETRGPLHHASHGPPPRAGEDLK